MRSRTDRRVPQRSDQRRETLLDELETSLQERSFDDINLGEVAERAGVSRSAFYFYFENKAAAVAALMERMVDDTFFVTDVFTMADQTPESRVHIMLDGLFDTWERHRHMFAAMLEARGRSLPVREFWDEARLSFVDAVAQMIRSERAAGSAPDGIDPVVLATMLRGQRPPVGASDLRRAAGSQSTGRGAAAIWLGSVYGITVQHGRQL